MVWLCAEACHAPGRGAWSNLRFVVRSDLSRTCFALACPLRARRNARGSSPCPSLVHIARPSVASVCPGSCQGAFGDVRRMGGAPGAAGFAKPRQGSTGTVLVANSRYRMPSAAQRARFDSKAIVTCAAAAERARWPTLPLRSQHLSLARPVPKPGTDVAHRNRPRAPFSHAFAKHRGKARKRHGLPRSGSQWWCRVPSPAANLTKQVRSIEPHSRTFAPATPVPHRSARA